MQGAYVPYIVTELFLMIYAAAILFRLHEGVGLERETKGLKKMILAYLVMVGTDVFWAFVENGTFLPNHYLNAAMNAISITATALGCFYWCFFVEIRLNGIEKWPKWIETVLYVPITLISIINMLSIFTGWVFYIDAAGHYRLGKEFWIQELITFSYLLIPTFHAVYAAIRAENKAKRKEYITYVFYILIPTTIVWIADSYPTVPLFALTIFTVILILFLTLYLNQEYILARKERELTQAHMATMLSQIQPHFIYNSLAVIQELCHGKAPEAEQAAFDFACFLRGNIDSLSQKTMIPFTMELEHTKYYLAMECKRFGEDILHTSFQIGVSDFRIPSLTLQPIVENAVRYGIMKQGKGGTVTIVTAETKKTYVIQVTDDGVGFDVKKPVDDGQIHVGIQNVRNRLRLMCNGQLTIHSEPGKGTNVVITIPKRRENH